MTLLAFRPRRWSSASKNKPQLDEKGSFTVPTDAPPVPLPLSVHPGHPAHPAHLCVDSLQHAPAPAPSPSPMPMPMPTPSSTPTPPPPPGSGPFSKSLIPVSTPMQRSQGSSLPLTRETRAQKGSLWSRTISACTTSKATKGHRSTLPDHLLVRIFNHLAAPPCPPPKIVDNIGRMEDGGDRGSSTSALAASAAGIHALGRCTLVSRQFESLAAPILYRSLVYHDGHRRDPFLDMKSSGMTSAKRTLGRLVSNHPTHATTPSATPSLGSTRKSQLLAGTHSLRVAYHWHIWCHPRPLIPPLPNLQVLRIDLDSRQLENGLHVGDTVAAGAKNGLCRMLESVEPRDTVVFRGVSLFAERSAWEHLPRTVGRSVERVVYVVEAVRGARGARGRWNEDEIKAKEGLKGLALNLARQPRCGIQMQLPTPTSTDGDGRSEVVIIFRTASPDHPFDIKCTDPAKGPHAAASGSIPLSSPLARWSWVGGMIHDMSSALVAGGNDDIRRVTIVNAESLPPIAPMSNSLGIPPVLAHTIPTGEQDHERDQGELFATLLRKRLEVVEKPLYVLPAGAKDSGDWARVRVPRISVRAVGMDEYVKSEMREGEFEMAELGGWLGERSVRGNGEVEGRLVKQVRDDKVRVEGMGMNDGCGLVVKVVERQMKRKPVVRFES